MSRRGGDRTPEERERARRERERRRYERAGEPVPEHLLEPEERAAAAPPEPVAPEPEPFEAEPEPFEAEPDPVDAEPFAHEPAPVEPEPVAYEPPPVEPVGPEPAAYEPPLEPVEPEPAAPVEPPAAERGQSHDPQETVQWDVSQAWADEHPPHADVAAPAAAAHATQAHDHEHAAAVEQPPQAEPPPAHDPQATQAHDVQADWGAEWTDEHAAVEQPSEEHEAPLGTKRISGKDRMHLPHIHRPTRGERTGKGRGVRVKRPGETFGGGPRTRRSVGGRIFAGLFVLLGIALVWFLVSLFQPFGGGGDGSGRVAVTIPEGASAGDIGKLLANRGVVDSGFFFGLRATVSGERSNLKSGRYTLREDMSYGAALDALTSEPEVRRVATVSVSIPEGRSRRETARIARQSGLRGDYFTASRRSRQLDPRRYGAPAGATLEGFLFPATYELRRGARVQRLVDDQLRAFKQNFAGINLRFARSKQLTAYDVLTIASMVEREVSVARERPLVAAVIYNRLRDSIPLGIDATLRFEQNDWVNPLRQSVLDADTPYNTRRKLGLPPGPIGSPGLASIRAAANPARSDALYYVVRPGTCGEHAFAPSYEQHLQNVQRYEQARQAAGGRSPTRC
ncbi:endolytic transglycosylase MltG [Conexibacter woesei]|uniref:Endolytic murein transglycosylase n=1 Tax=Conexibacter woesei (strain DSM 14684 / CCUG 47730 / CIP 108061 / JCM 11494 / NBRC 100937 / ID131577) TaxID=469383 RepID=D3FCU3_CONWI|nr:endolytic transglycosylase MltG [Conexibacter woesei]ADB51455.1 aminodeoxychorismate lyase [Conexibacter woesei DSM 14684]